LSAINTIKSVIKYIDIDKLKPYANNPRKNDAAVDAVVKSIKSFGFKQPIVIDSNSNIVVGHTRLSAAKKLGSKQVPCIVADDLTDAQVKAYRIADNKTNEFSDWDLSLLAGELQNLDNEFTGFSDEESAKIIDSVSTNMDFIEDESEEGVLANTGGHLHESGAASVLFHFHTYRTKYNDDSEIVERIRSVAMSIVDRQDDETFINRANEIIIPKMIEALEELEQIV
jgi:ParB/RepB/Spo0J family partition protein